MKIDFDPNKSKRNIEERDLSFDRVSEFDFNTATVEQDVRKKYPEDRFVATGFLAEGVRLHVVCFTPIEGGIRVISFRKAHSKEVKAYEQNDPHSSAD